MSDHREDVGSTDGGSSGEDLESEVESEGVGSNQEKSSSESRESSSQKEESGSGSSSGSSASESDDETSKAKPDKAPLKAPSEMDHNISQAASMTKINDNDLEDKWQSNHYDFAWSLDKEFGEWRDPHKRPKHSDPVGAPIAYMESQGTFKDIKTREYGLSLFHQVSNLGDFPTFPESQEPATSDDVHCLLQKAHKLVRPNYGTQFFHFHIHFRRKVPTSEDHAPLQEILDPPLYLDLVLPNIVFFVCNI